MYTKINYLLYIVAYNVIKLGENNRIYLPIVQFFFLRFSVGRYYTYMAILHALTN